MNIHKQIQNEASLVLIDPKKQIKLKEIFLDFNLLKEKRYSIIYKDIKRLNINYSGKMFWLDIIKKSTKQFNDNNDHLKNIERKATSNFNLFEVEKYFHAISNSEKRVLLFLDHIDAVFERLQKEHIKTILHGIRHFSSLTNGLTVVASSQCNISELNSKSYNLNPLGSPFFNTFQEIIIN